MRLSIDRKVSGLCAGQQRKPAFFQDGTLSRRKKPGFSPVRPVTA
ncbi:Uncharacterized protein dnm_030880 [Desulfonema magnum]|uniref:Uncharacterized protein n=1 Tax=Desulfonema magnum TaxID=45655 RepID=A0A975BKA1_9BACT|nr:Uncharacterized protein dnm_030880 [Desulfonema magnum]